MKKLYFWMPIFCLFLVASFSGMATSLFHTKQPGLHTIQSRGISEDKKYTWDIESPYVIRLTDQKRQEVVNQWMDCKVKNVISEFQSELKNHACLSCPPSVQNGRGSLVVRYEKIFLSSDLLSLRMDAMKSFPGDAHPINLLMTLNYNLRAQKPIELKDLFDSHDYLDQLSSIAYHNLVNRIPNLYGFSPKAPPKYLDLESVKKWIREGTAPQFKNYHYFGLTDKTLILFFDQYQVAPRPAGIVTVEIPFAVLKGFKIHA